jgi:hypothetical protein
MGMKPCALLVLATFIGGCTQEQQNKLSRGIQNWTGIKQAPNSNLNFQVDEGEKKVYFEISDYSTPYVFFADPA